MKSYKLDYEQIYMFTAKQLLENKIVGWFQGKSEFGPRALGNRSILSNPMIDNVDYLNLEVKKREWWRPYAPIVLEQYAHDYFDFPRETSPYMLFSGFVKQEQLGKIPAVTHKDNSSRIQTVNENQNKHVYKLIEMFYNIGGVPLLLNTSFNMAGEPIVQTPSDAINTFENSLIDVLVINNYLIMK